eukprot:1544999-Rhodomonas_salina.2
MKRFCWYKLVPECLRRFHGAAHIFVLCPAPVKHAQPHLRCYNLQKTLALQVHIQPDPTNEWSPDRSQTPMQISISGSFMLVPRPSYAADLISICTSNISTLMAAALSPAVCLVRHKPQGQTAEQAAQISCTRPLALAAHPSEAATLAPERSHNISERMTHEGDQIAAWLCTNAELVEKHVGHRSAAKGP